MSNFFNVLKNFSFEGRASRQEYWMYMLFFIPILLFAAFSSQLIGENAGAALYVVLTLGTFVQNLALGVRRMHDIDKSGWFVLVSVIPFVGGIIYLVMCASAGTSGPNNYGHDPHNPHSSGTVVGGGGWKKVG